MVQKSLKALNGIKGNIPLYERKNRHKRYIKNTNEEIDICLNCTIPVEKCKGDCKFKRKK